MSFRVVLNNGFEILVLIAIFLIPLGAVITVPGTDVWYSQYLCLFSIFVAGAVLFLLNFNRLIALFLGLAWFSTIFTAGQNPRAMLCLFQVIFGCIAIKLISEFREKAIWRLIRAIFWISLINSLYVVIQYFNLDPIFNSVKDFSKDDTVGFLGSHNQLGVFMSVTTPSVMVIFPPAMLLNFFAIFCSKTLSSFVATSVCFLFLSVFWWKDIFLRKSRTIWVVILIVILAGYVFFRNFEHFSSEAYGERINLYKHTINSVLKERIYLRLDNNMTFVKTCNSWLGYGFASFMGLSPRSQTQFLRDPSPTSHRYEHAHNDYLEVLFEMGKLGFIVLMAVIFDIFIKFIKAHKTRILVISFASLLAHMVNSLGIYAVQTAPSGILLILFLGIFYGEIFRQKGMIYASKI